MRGERPLDEARDLRGRRSAHDRVQLDEVGAIEHQVSSAVSVEQGAHRLAPMLVRVAVGEDALGAVVGRQPEEPRREQEDQERERAGQGLLSPRQPHDQGGEQRARGQRDDRVAPVQERHAGELRSEAEREQGHQEPEHDLRDAVPPRAGDSPTDRGRERGGCRHDGEDPRVDEPARDHPEGHGRASGGGDPVELVAARQERLELKAPGSQ